MTLINISRRSYLRMKVTENRHKPKIFFKIINEVLNEAQPTVYLPELTDSECQKHKHSKFIQKQKYENIVTLDTNSTNELDMKPHYEKYNSNNL